MVPGSHRLGRGPEPGEGADRAVPVEGPAAWLGNTWHGAFPKLTEGLRLNLTSYHCHPALKTQERYGAAVPPAMLARRSARFRRLMGVDDPMGWKEHGPDGERFITLAARQTLADEEAAAGKIGALMPRPARSYRRQFRDRNAGRAWPSGRV